MNLVNFRDILITLLLHGGGLRQSEPFHIYFDDIQLDPVLSRQVGEEVALVRIYHPSEGAIPTHMVTHFNKSSLIKDRESFLIYQYGLKPRTHYVTESLRAGWKTTQHDSQHDKYIQVHWFPVSFGILFYKIWKLYILSLQTHRFSLSHPFAFVALTGKHKGKPLSISAFRQNHKAAEERIGLSAAKEYGTTPHGHRHAYGQRMVECDVAPLIRKKALHHRSIESQLVYTQPSYHKVNDCLRTASVNLDHSQYEFENLWPNLEHGFADVDPLGLMSGSHPQLS